MTVIIVDHLGYEETKSELLTVLTHFTLLYITFSLSLRWLVTLVPHILLSTGRAPVRQETGYDLTQAVCLSTCPPRAWL